MLPSGAGAGVSRATHGTPQHEAFGPLGYEVSWFRSQVTVARTVPETTLPRVALASTRRSRRVRRVRDMGPPRVVVSGWVAGRLAVHVRTRRKIDSRLRQGTNQVAYPGCSAHAAHGGGE